tara:strand:+ start:4363 stop:6408 length:2046 start_codon:yes stop_codon:yes gene_type:complete
MSRTAHKLLTGSGATADSGDDDFNLVTTLLPANGSNAAQNSTFIDSSDNNLTVTPGTEAPAQGTFSPFSKDVGKWSVEFDGSSNLLWTSGHFQFGTGDYTVECFVFFTGNDSTSGGIFQLSTGNNDGSSPAMALRDTTGLTIYTSSGQKITGNNNTFAMGVWYHLAFVRQSNVVRVYKDGALVTWNDGSTSAADTTNITSTAMNVGRYYSDSYRLKGYISNFRVNKGTAVYTGAFTKPTAPLTDITNTKLIACSTNNHLFERSSINMAITNTYGTAKTKPFSPFKNDAEYDPAVHGGSFLFGQNANSSLSVSHASLFDFGTADYCIEAWLYPTQTSYSNSWAMWASTIGVNQYWAYTNGGGNQAAAGFSSYPAGGYSGANWHQATSYVWNHIVFQNTGGYENWYKNGTRIYNVQNNPNHGSSATGMMFGRANHYASYFYYGGYMSDVRVITGTNYNPYSNAASLTVPTAPLTKTSYTRLLLNGTNAAIKDVSGSNNIRTLDNAQLDTAIKKFGTASMRFDNTNDYLTLPQTEFKPFGMGDFTIECFVYFDTVTSSGIFQLSNGYLNSTTRGPAAGCSSTTGKWGIYRGTTWDEPVSSQVPSTNTWYHMALVRNSGTVKLYIDGAVMVSATDTTNYTDTYFVIGGWYSTGYLMHGRIDEFRITHKARYTSTFDVPTEAFPNI